MTAEPDKQEPFGGLGSEILADATTGAAMGGALGAFIGGATAFIKRFAELSKQELTEQRWRQNEVWNIASVIAGQDAEDLALLALEDRDKGHLALTATAVAARSRIDAKIRVLGEALAVGLTSTDYVMLDIEQQVVDALDVIERPHLEVMWSFLTGTDSGDRSTWTEHVWDWNDLTARHEPYRRVLSRLLSQLERDGVVARQVRAVTGSAKNRPARESYVGVYWALTEFGRILLERLYDTGVEELERRE